MGLIRYFQKMGGYTVFQPIRSRTRIRLNSKGWNRNNKFLQVFGNLWQPNSFSVKFGLKSRTPTVFDPNNLEPNFKFYQKAADYNLVILTSVNSGWMVVECMPFLWKKALILAATIMYSADVWKVTWAVAIILLPLNFQMCSSCTFEMAGILLTRSRFSLATSISLGTVCNRIRPDSFTKIKVN